jgi:hypothetical protein
MNHTVSHQVAGRSSLDGVSGRKGVELVAPLASSTPNVHRRRAERSLFSWF